MKRILKRQNKKVTGYLSKKETEVKNYWKEKWDNFSNKLEAKLGENMKETIQSCNETIKNYKETINYVKDISKKVKETVKAGSEIAGNIKEIVDNAKIITDDAKISVKSIT